ncbi:MAG: hypothetical protein RI894_1165 [Bacteroidota bacterium]|jgi:5-(carboxyamino)imidazole ribonucleotide synthase
MNKVLGILGGGQLGKMLLYDTRKWDIFTRVLEADSEAPARLACNAFIKGSLLDAKAVYDFGQKCDILTIEIENVSLEALQKLESEGKKVFPQPAVLQIIQDKTVQKAFYLKNGLPTAPFFVFETKNALLNALKEEKLHFPFVWKAPRFGYDGKGVKIIRNLGGIEALPDSSMLIEELIAIRKELAVTVARNEQGEMRAFPVVEMDFHGDANLVELVGCPAQISVFQEVKATELAEKLAEKLQIIGSLSVEMFLTLDGEILINEAAPRPHNSAHLFSQACHTSQFEQHLRAILGFPLGDTSLHTPAVMLNLVGEEGHSGAVHYAGFEQALSIAGVTPHIYGKKETRPFRKMGHVNITAPTLAEAYKKATQVQRILKVKS